MANKDVFGPLHHAVDVYSGMIRNKAVGQVETANMTDMTYVVNRNEMIVGGPITQLERRLFSRFPDVVGISRLPAVDAAFRLVTGAGLDDEIPAKNAYIFEPEVDFPKQSQEILGVLTVRGKVRGDVPVWCSTVLYHVIEKAPQGGHQPTKLLAQTEPVLPATYILPDVKLSSLVDQQKRYVPVSGGYPGAPEVGWQHVSGKTGTRLTIGGLLSSIAPILAQNPHETLERAKYGQA